LPDRDPLPQLSADRPFVTDGGLETTPIFQRGLVLPDFAAFVLLQDAAGRQALHDYCWAAAAAPTIVTWPR
jgi:hypothetical protein